MNEELKTKTDETGETETLLEGQKRVLEMIAGDAPLEQSLAALIRLIESQAPGMLGSVLLLDDKNGQLHNGAAPSLPAEYVEALEGRAMGPRAGSCGTAAFRKEAVYVEDIASDPLWKDYRALALPHGLRACWSTPIVSAEKRILGTFAMYYREPRLPELEHIKLIGTATHIACIAICNYLDQKALKESAAKLKEAQRLAHIGYWEHDLIADRVTWSDETARIAGLQPPPEGLSQAELEKLIHPEDRQIRRQALADALKGKRLYDLEYRIVRPDGGVRFIHVRDEIEFDAQGRPARMFGTVQDITERKRAEALLTAREQEIRAIVENSPDLIVRFDLELKRTYVNPAFVKAAGVEKVALLGKRIDSALREGTAPATAEEVEIAEKSIRHVFESGRPLDLELTWPMDGNRRSYAVHLEPEFDANGTLNSVLSVSRDITERREAEEAVRESQQLLQQVLATLPVGVTVTNLSGDIVLANAASREIWGETVVAGPERWARTVGFWHESGGRIRPFEWASVRALSKGETILDELIDIETYDGAQKIIRNSAAPIRNTDGAIVGAVIVNEDVTELKQGEEKLRQTQTELAHVSRLTTVGELTAAIAHEVNQPLAAVVANAGAVLRWLAAAPPNIHEAREALQRIARDGNRASEVLLRIRALVKKTEPARSAVQVNKLIQETIGLLRPEWGRMKVSLQLDLDPDLPPVPADPVQLQQVLLNLMVNAVDSMMAVEDRPRILCIHTDRQSADIVHAVVQDTGAGVSPQDYERLFEPFYTTKAHGLGMGLAISRSIVESHGGRLWVSPNEPHGTRFEFTLPVREGG